MRWFRPFGFVFVPVSIPGRTITLLAVAFCVHIFWFVEGHSHSVSDTLYSVFPYWIPTFLLWVWIASQTSEERKRQDSVSDTMTRTNPRVMLSEDGASRFAKLRRSRSTPTLQQKLTRGLGNRSNSCD